MITRTLLLLPSWSGRNHSIFLGVCDLRSYLLDNGVETEILDCDVLTFAARKEGIPIDDIIRTYLIDYNPSFIGIHINTPNYESAINLAKLVKSILPQAILFAGGMLPSLGGSFFPCIMILIILSKVKVKNQLLN